MLEGFSSDFHISPEQFVAMCDHGLSTGTFDEVSEYLQKSLWNETLLQTYVPTGPRYIADSVFFWYLILRGTPLA
jgi:hypothetical protein